MLPMLNTAVRYNKT